VNKLLVSGILILSIGVFYTFSKETAIHSTNKKKIVNNNSTSELRSQEKNGATKTLETSLHKDPVQANLIKIKKQARLDDDKKFLDKDKLILNDLAILDRMNDDERAEYYQRKELENVVGNEIANNDSAIDMPYDAAILNKMTEDEEAEYYKKKELKNMSVQEIDNNDAIDIPYEVLNPPE